MTFHEHNVIGFGFACFCIGFAIGASVTFFEFAMKDDDQGAQVNESLVRWVPVPMTRHWEKIGRDSILTWSRSKLDSLQKAIDKMSH